MAARKRRKMLIALDGSDRAFETVRYVSEIPPFREMSAVLFTVVSNIPERYWDLEAHPNVGRRVREIRAWQTRNETFIREYMIDAKRRLVKAGFSEDAIYINIHERQKGIARDLVTEARKGYHAVVVGRKGLSKTRGLVMGSVTAKLLEKITFTPVFVVGRHRKPEKVLLALDGSDVSMQIVDYVGTMLPQCDCEVTLAHVIRGEDKAASEAAEERIAPVFSLGKSHLMNCGFPQEKIHNKIITGVLSRAGAIVREAKEGGYCTIVVGRRGISQTRSFFMGRVSNKVVQLARGMVVWVIS